MEELLNAILSELELRAAKLAEARNSAQPVSNLDSTQGAIMALVMVLEKVELGEHRLRVTDRLQACYEGIGWSAAGLYLAQAHEKIFGAKNI